jgi:hypothetical protein
MFHVKRILHNTLIFQEFTHPSLGAPQRRRRHNLGVERAKTNMFCALFARECTKARDFRSILSILTQP